ncbi:MAG: acyltransferase family protein [Gammaproteobacteria bacterium]|nr:acyltransferase family protein [Gammaproteobacteria bacterium]
MHVKSVDALKCFAILAVILGHIGTPFTTFIFGWHMPLFFFIAGFFIKPDETIKVHLIKSSKRLLIPYVIFALIGLLVVMIKNPVLHRPEASLSEGLMAIFYYMDTAHITTYANVLWFLPTLFLCRLSLLLLLKFIKNTFVIALITIGLACLSVGLNLTLAFALPQVMASLIWVYAGYLFFNHYRQTPWFENKVYFSLSVLLLALPLIYFNMPLLNVAEMSFSDPLYNYVYSLIIVWLISSMFIKIDLLSRSNLVNWIGANTMSIFIFHTYTNNLSQALVAHFIPGAWYITFMLSLGMLAVLLRLKQKIQHYSWASILRMI